LDSHSGRPPHAFGCRSRFSALGGHSRGEKPKIFLEKIERLYPTTPKIELNCVGQPRPGWDGWGAEAEE
jgi:N6-adenosine-specific RNA methylase IME4